MKYPAIALLFLSAVFTGCSSGKPVDYQSKWKQHTLFYEQSPTDDVDMKSRLKFGVQNNDDKLFVSIATREPDLISRIISSGIRLSVSPDGSKKATTKLLFPVVLKQDRRAIRKMEHVDMLGPSMQLLLDTFNKEALINQGAGDRFINLVDNNEELYCKINMTPDGELSIDYALPLKSINPVNSPQLALSLLLEGASRSGGFSPGISVGVGAGSYGGMGMGGMGVGIGTGGRNSYGNQNVELKLNVVLASK